MKRGILLIVWLVFLASIALHAQGTLEGPTQIPSTAGNQKEPAIAANLAGDILIVFRDGYNGVMYNFIDRNGTKYGNKTIPGQAEKYASNYIKYIVNTDVCADTSGMFHISWLVQRMDKLFYCTFNPITRNPSAIKAIAIGAHEGLAMRVNPINDDVVVAYTRYIGQKDMYVKVKKANSSNWDITVPIYQYKRSATLPDCTFDEEGFLYVTGKQKYPNLADTHSIYMGMLNSNRGYRLSWHGDLTKEYGGWQFFPSAAAINKSGGMICSYSKTFSYHYLQFQRVQQGSYWTVKFDASNWTKQTLALVPPIHPRYQSKLLPYQDEFIWVYLDNAITLKMTRFDTDFRKINDTPIPISKGHVGTQWMDVDICPSIGVLSTWQSISEPYVVRYSIYHYPKEFASVKSAVPNPVERKKIEEKSYFFAQIKYQNVVTWEEHEDNIKYSKIYTVVKYKLYRRRPGETWNTGHLLKEFAQGSSEYQNKSYLDDNLPIGNESENNYIYCVTCVDDKGNESDLGEYEGN